VKKSSSFTVQLLLAVFMAEKASAVAVAAAVTTTATFGMCGKMRKCEKNQHERYRGQVQSKYFTQPSFSQMEKRNS